ncbi:recombinase family protein [Nocardia fluminea]|uniref:recombinase family protein n=1 Tax=Nocardia fluminea TaxID=134984 RepID=UPI003F4DAAF8
MVAETTVSVALSVMGAFAEFERSLILERQREGIAAAKTRGVYTGRKPALTNDQAEQIRTCAAECDRSRYWPKNSESAAKPCTPTYAKGWHRSHTRCHPFAVSGTPHTSPTTDCDTTRPPHVAIGRQLLPSAPVLPDGYERDRRSPSHRQTCTSAEFMTIKWQSDTDRPVLSAP